MSGKMLKRHETAINAINDLMIFWMQECLQKLLTKVSTWFDIVGAASCGVSFELAAQARLRARRADFDVTALPNCTRCCWRIIAFKEVKGLAKSRTKLGKD